MQASTIFLAFASLVGQVVAIPQPDNEHQVGYYLCLTHFM